MNNHRFGKSFEKLDTDNQIAFLEVDAVKPRSRKVKGKRAEEPKDLPIVPVSHMMSEQELIAEFGENGWYQLEDEIYNRYRFTPAKVEVKEHHAGVYKSKKDNHFKKADHPGYLPRNSLVSESLEVAVINAKYVNAVPLYRQEQEFERYGLNITRGEMAHWTILCAERYLSIFYDYLHKKMYGCHVLQAHRLIRIPAIQKCEPSAKIPKRLQRNLCNGWISGLSHHGEGT